jgi:hypothetical protein
MRIRREHAWGRVILPTERLRHLARQGGRDAADRASEGGSR